MVVGTTAFVVTLTPDAEEPLCRLVWLVMVRVAPALEVETEAAPVPPPLVGDDFVPAPDPVLVIDSVVLCPAPVCEEVVKGLCDDDDDDDDAADGGVTATGTGPNAVVESAAGGNSPPLAAVAMLNISPATLFSGSGESTARSRT